MQLRIKGGPVAVTVHGTKQLWRSHRWNSFIKKHQLIFADSCALNNDEPPVKDISRVTAVLYIYISDTSMTSCIVDMDEVSHNRRMEMAYNIWTVIAVCMRYTVSSVICRNALRQTEVTDTCTCNMKLGGNRSLLILSI